MRVPLVINYKPSTNLNQGAQANMTQEAKTISKPKTKTKPNPKLTAKQEKIITIRNDNPGMTNQQIADIAGTSSGYVSDVLQKYGLNKENVDDYNKNKIEIWQGITARILSKISDQDIEKGSLQQKITAAGIAFDKTQVLTGGARDVTPMIIVNRVSIESQSVDNSEIITVDNSDSL
jgi:hypothetical protein